MGKYGRQIVKDEFSLERVVRDTMDVYDELLEYSTVKEGTEL
jgi:hypothetical protein